MSSRISKPAPVVVIRCGDADDYHTFDDIAEAAEYLIECAVGPELERYDRYGLCDDIYRDCNYISAYWGTPDEDLDPVRRLRAVEVRQISAALRDAYDDKGARR